MLEMFQGNAFVVSAEDFLGNRNLNREVTDSFTAKCVLESSVSNLGSNLLFLVCMKQTNSVQSLCIHAATLTLNYFISDALPELAILEFLCEFPNRTEISGP